MITFIGYIALVIAFLMAAFHALETVITPSFKIEDLDRRLEIVSIRCNVIRNLALFLLVATFCFK